MTTGSFEDSISTTVDELVFVETTCVNSGIWEDDASPEVLMVLVLVERCRLRHTEVAFGGKGGFNASLHERRGKGFYSSTMTYLFHDQK